MVGGVAEAIEDPSRQTTPRLPLMTTPLRYVPAHPLLSAFSRLEAASIHLNRWSGTSCTRCSSCKTRHSAREAVSVDVEVCDRRNAEGGWLGLWGSGAVSELGGRGVLFENRGIP